MSPYRDHHSCTINEEVTKIEEVKRKKTKFGSVQYIYGRNSKGALKLRGIRIPSNISVATAKDLCKSAGGIFHPATPTDPKKQLLTDFKDMCLTEKKAILRSLIHDFEMPIDYLSLTEWTTAYINDLPDSCFLIILPGGKKDSGGKTKPRSFRLLPYRDKNGHIDKAHVRNALARINQTKAPISMKKNALTKLLRIAKTLGMVVKEKEKFKLSDLFFYIDMLREIE